MKNKQVDLDHDLGTFHLSSSDRREIFINILIISGTISFIFLVLMFGYQQLLKFLTINLGWTIKTNLQNNPFMYTLYNKSNQILIGLYLVSMIIFVTLRYISERNRIVLRYIRHYISAMAKGNYNLRIPTENIGDYETLSHDVNTLMDSINQAFQERDHVEKTKDELMNNIGHDIRTPLTSILGYLRLIKDSPQLSPTEVEEHLATVNSKAKSMQVLINDLFEYTSSQQTTATMAIQKVPIQPFVDQIVADFMLQAQEKGLDIQVQVQPPNLMMRIDPEKMARVFNNYITNALKYGEGADYLKINIWKEEASDPTKIKQNTFPTKKACPSGNKVVMEFRNNGPLLSDQDLERIYERSFRTDSSRTSQKPGSGLGLAIVRNLVELHHGITYGRVEGKDLVFRVELPYHMTDKTHEQMLQSM